MHWMQQSTSTSTLTVKAPQMIQQYNRQGIEILAYRGSSIAYNVSIDIVYIYMYLRYTFWMVFGISFYTHNNQPAINIPTAYHIY